MYIRVYNNSYYLPTYEYEVGNRMNRDIHPKTIRTTGRGINRSAFQVDLLKCKYCRAAKNTIMVKV